MFIGKLFGSPEFFYCDRAVVFSSRKALALLCYLLVEGKVTREKAAGLLWSEKEEATAQKNLRNTLYLLKKMTPEGCVLSDRQWIFLGARDAIRTDLEKLDEMETMSVEQCLGFIPPFLDGLYIKECPVFDEWLQQVRYFYEERAAVALKKRAARACEEGLLEDGLRLLHAYYGKNRLDEEACRLLMTAYGKQQDKNKVRELYRNLERHLKKELGMFPGKRTRNVYETFLEGELPDGETIFVEESMPSECRDDWFYGREREMDEIRSFLDGASRVLRCLLVIGEAGVGKSCLIGKFLENSDKYLLLSARGVEEGREISLFPFHDLMKNLAAQIDLGRVAPSFPERVKVVLGETFPALNLEVAFESTSFSRIGRMLAELFRELRANGPIRLVLEDLQWFDDASLQVLENFLGGDPGEIEILMASRLDVSPKIVKTLKSFAGMGLIKYKMIYLKSFDMEDVERFCRKGLGGRRLSPQIVEKLYEYSGGLPLYLKNYLSLIVQKKSIEDIPDNVKEAIERVLAGLGDKERRILECMSVFLNEVNWELLRNVCECTEEVLAEAVELLCRKGIVKELHHDSGDRLFFLFKHAKVKEHVYGSLSETKRRMLHQRVVHALKVDDNRDQWKDFEGAKMIFHCRRAGMILDELYLSLKRLDFQNRLNYELFPLLDDDTLHRSSAAFEDIEETRRRFLEIQVLLGKVREQMGETDVYKNLEMTYRTLLGGYLVWWGEHSRGGAFLRSALGWAALKDERELELKCLQNLCYLFIQTEEGQRLDSLAERYMHAAERCFDEPAYGAALRFKGLAAAFEGDFEKALEYFDSSNGFFEDIEVAGKCFTLQKEAARKYQGEVFHKKGIFNKAVESFNQCLKNCDLKGIHRGNFSFHSNLAHVFFDMGEFDLAENHVQEALDFMEDRKWWRGNSVVYSIKSFLCARIKNERLALEYLKKADDICLKLNKKYWLALQLFVKGVISKERLEQEELRSFLSLQPVTYFYEAGRIYEDIGVEFMAKRMREMGISFALPQEAKGGGEE